ncbi:LOW QUALITY PROTEIN: MAP7 domain-containing protein 3 [Molossus nigricans]
MQKLQQLNAEIVLAFLEIEKIIHEQLQISLSKENTALRMRKLKLNITFPDHTVAAAHAIAQERHHQSVNSLQSQSSNTRSAVKPVIDGSVLNDIKQKLAKECREEKRIKDATKEIQLLEKENNSKIQYENQMEGKQQKFREQKQKDEQQRISTEEKRKQKLREEREKFKAVVSHTLERSNRIDLSKRWSWEGSMTVKSESKMVKKQSMSSEKLKQETSVNKQMTVSSSGLQNSVAKIFNIRRDFITPTKAAVARSKSASSLSIPGKDILGIYNPVIYIDMPLLSHSSHELKNTIVLCKSTVAVPPQEKIDTLFKGSLEAAPEVSVEAAPEASIGAVPEDSVEVAPEVSVEVPIRVGVEAAPAVSVEATPKASIKAFPKMSVEPLPENLETSPEGHDMCLVNEDPSTEVSTDSSEGNLDSFPEVSMETSEACMEVFHKASMEMIPEKSLETILEKSMDAPEASVEAPPESKSWPEVSVETSSKVKHTLYVQNVLGTIRRKEEAASITTANSEAVNQKHMTCEESGNKSTQGIMNAEGATTILAAKHLARKHLKKKKNYKKKMEQRKEKDMAKKAVECQEEFSKFDNGQQQKEIRKKKGYQDQGNQQVLQQKGDTKLKAQEEVNKLKKEQEKIMLQNSQERLEEKKDTHIFSSDTYEEHEANDEDESESDSTDLFDDLHPSVKDPLAQAKGIRLSTKMTNQVTKTRKTTETSNTMVLSKHLYSMSQNKCMCDQILDSNSKTDPLLSRILPDSHKHHPKGSTTFHQSPQILLDDRNINI